MSDPTKPERDWAREQLGRSAVPRAAQAAVMQLLGQWVSSYIAQMKPEERQAALDAFYSLAQGHSLAPETEGDANWQPVKRGNIFVRETVRVKSDAYVGALGRAHNGRQGRIIAIRQGDVIIKYDDDRQPNPEMGTRHSPEALEKRL